MNSEPTKDQDEEESGFLEGQLLIAMPTMTDPRFQRAVIYICAHSEDGAMGLIINRAAENLSAPELLQRLGISTDIEDSSENTIELPVQFGGPVEKGRGFVLHSPDYFVEDSTLEIDDDISLTATLDILRAIAEGRGPERALLALGYAGWSPGQLESEIHANGWLNSDPDPDIVFGDALETKYERALAKLGIDLSHLASDAGHC